MDDKKIIELFLQRDDGALKQTQIKYGGYCFTIANNILSCREDVEECVADVYFKLWNSIPPHIPHCLSSFIGRITRNTALDRYAKNKAEKRFSPVQAAFDELDRCLADPSCSFSPLDEIVLREAVNGFLGELKPKARIIFVRRYWYFSSIEDIARDYGYSKSDVKTTLMRTREKFRLHLVKAGVMVKKD